ncbi:MAG TPA: M23 family metallopeptidase [Candidatus Limnocylindrales bacterium]|nr:M23 family metallopeptidase [Candidatus Limnocylindrales bacterium]
MTPSWPGRRRQAGRIGGQRPIGGHRSRGPLLGAGLALVLGVAASAAPILPGIHLLTEAPLPHGGAAASLLAAATSGPLATAPLPTPAGPTVIPQRAGSDSGQATGDTTPAVPQSAPSEDLRGYVWPIHDARITTWFGPLEAGGFVMFGTHSGHDGLDITTFCGDTVRAAHDGVVLYAGRKFDPYLGYDVRPDAFYVRLKELGASDLSLPIVVVVDDGDGYRSVYVHLASASVHAGQHVSAGRTAIGREGRTGDATGCHLHYELIRMDGPWLQVAPEQVARFDYPGWVRERVDPLLVLDPFASGAARRVPGLDPPTVFPGGYTYAGLLALWRVKDRMPGPGHS